MGEMASPRRGSWWVPVVLGALFFATAVVGVFDPTEDAVNPYNYLELYAEMPIPETIDNLVKLFLGVFGIWTIITIEFAFPGRSTLRSLQSPTHLFTAVIGIVGFLLFSISRIQLLEIIPDLAHYYFADGGQHSDSSAIASSIVELDRDGWFLFGGNSVWVIFFCVEQLHRRHLSPLMSIAGLLLGAGLAAMLIVLLLDAGFWATVVSMITIAAIAPFWFIGMGIVVRRRYRES